MLTVPSWLPYRIVLGVAHLPPYTVLTALSRSSTVLLLTPIRGHMQALGMPEKPEVVEETDEDLMTWFG